MYNIPHSEIQTRNISKAQPLAIITIHLTLLTNCQLPGPTLSSDSIQEEGALRQRSTHAEIIILNVHTEALETSAKNATVQVMPIEQTFYLEF